MIVKTDVRSAFVSQRLLDRVAKAGRWKKARRSQWLMVPSAGRGPAPLGETPARLIRALMVSAQLSEEDVYKAVMGFVWKAKKVCGVECPDGTLVHPAAVGLALFGVGSSEGREWMKARLRAKEGGS